MNWELIWHIILATFIYNRISSIFYFVYSSIGEANDKIDKEERESFDDKLKKKL